MPIVAKVSSTMRTVSVLPLMDADPTRVAMPREKPRGQAGCDSLVPLEPIDLCMCRSGAVSRRGKASGHEQSSREGRAEPS